MATMVTAPGVQFGVRATSGIHRGRAARRRGHTREIVKVESLEGGSQGAGL